MFHKFRDEDIMKLCNFLYQLAMYIGLVGDIMYTEN